MKTLRLKYLALVITCLSGAAHASGFALVEQNASGLGNAYAGQAAVAQDASTIYFNPAGMTLLPDSQLVVVGHLIKPTIEFSGTVSPAVGGGQGGDAGDWAFVPNFYYAYRLTPQIRLGIGLGAPFGLKSEYAPDWIGRYQAIKSEVKTVNLNPSIAYRLSDTLSVGLGLNFQRLDAELTNMQPLGVLPGAPSTLVRIKADDYGWGYNLGALWQVAPATRIGLSYRSEVKYTLKGDASTNPNVGGGSVKADITLPDSASLSLFHKLSPKWDMLADITWTGWSKFDKLAIAGAVNKSTPENWDDILRYSLGVTWHMSDKLSLRGGVAYDEAVVSDTYRTPRIPDGARTWVAVGGQYRVSESGVFDFGYAHLFVNNPSLSITDNQTTLMGTYHGFIDIVSMQYTHSF